MKISLECELNDDGSITIKKTEDISVEDFYNIFMTGKRIVLDETFFDDTDQIPGQMCIEDFV